MVFHVNCGSDANLTLKLYTRAWKLWSRDMYKFLPNQGASAAWFQRSFESMCTEALILYDKVVNFER